MPGFAPLGAKALGATPVSGVLVIADDLFAGVPVLDAPALSQVHALVASDIVTGAVALDAPSLAQVHVLTAVDIDTGAPVPDTPALLVTVQFTASDLDAGAPALDAPPIAQVHVLHTGTSMITTGHRPLGARALGAMPYSEQVIFDPNLDTDAPTLETPALHQVHHLTADDITAGTPLLGGSILISPSGLFVRYAGDWYAPVAYGKHEGAWKDILKAYRRGAAGWELIYERLN